MGREGVERGEGRECGTRLAGARRRRGRGRRARGDVTGTTPPDTYGEWRSSGAHAAHPRAADPSWAGGGLQHPPQVQHHPSPSHHIPTLSPPPPPSRPTREIASVQCEWLQLVHSLVSAGGKAFRPAVKTLERPPRPPHPQDTVHCQVRPAEHGRMSCIERWPSCRSLAGRPGPIRLSNLNGRGRWNGPHVCTSVLSCGVRSVDP